MHSRTMLFFIVHVLRSLKAYNRAIYRGVLHSGHTAHKQALGGVVAGFVSIYAHIYLYAYIHITFSAFAERLLSEVCDPSLRRLHEQT